jgi:hypothetical protein
MKKIVLLIATIFLWAGSVFSQTVLYEDNLDSYPLDSYLHTVNPTWWSTWSGGVDGEDIQIKNTYSLSPSQSGSADKVGGQSDCLLLLGDRVSGVYQLSWWMYIETGKCGYYNMQHFESPGIEWAYEIYFRTDGSIECLQGGNTLGGTYPHDVFFQVIQDVDLDADLVTVTINGTVIGSWPISDEAQNSGGTKQMGAIDFFAGEASGSGETPGYYIDDVYFAQIEAGNDPIIGADPVAVATWLLGGTTGTQNLSILNTGTADLTYDINIVYDVDAVKSAPAQSGSDNTYYVKRSLTNASTDPTPNPGPPCPGSDATAQLHYDGDNNSAIGWNTVPVTVTVAARFTNPMVIPYAGMNITSVEVFVNDLNAGSNAMKIKVYGMGNTYEPGDLLGEQDFTPGGANWETVTLTNPIPVTGEDLWVGYQFTQTDASIYIPGTDAGPADPNGDFLSTGVGWSHLSSNPLLDFNWNIRANLVGNVMVHWLTASPMSGTVPPLGSNPTLLGFDATTLALGTYTATIKLLSNDPATPVLDVPVTLQVAGVGIPELGNLGVMIYPNPAQENLNIVTNGTFNKVTITDFTGKVVFIGNSKSIDISALSNGVYFVKVETTQGISNTKFIKK